MKFIIEEHSSVSPIKQIQEQVKLAVAMGIVRNGDNLPSIREVERMTGINRAQVHRAYRALSQHGFLVLTRGRGKGAVVSTSAASPDLMNKKCRKLAENLVSNVRRLGLSPTAYARYLSQQMLEFERRHPFIAYADPYKAVAENRAAEVSQLWQVPVIGLTITELKSAVRKSTQLRKILTNHLMRDRIQSSLTGETIEVIAIGARYSEQMIKEFASIRPHSSVLRILAPHALPNARFILAQLQKRIKAPEVEISVVSVADRSFKRLLNGSAYDYIVVDPNTLNEIPRKWLKSRRILVVRMQLDSKSLEAARIRAGVIV